MQNCLKSSQHVRWFLVAWICHRQEFFCKFIHRSQPTMQPWEHGTDGPGPIYLSIFKLLQFHSGMTAH